MASENEGNKNLEAIKQKISPVIRSLSASINNVSETREKAKASKADEVEKKVELIPFNKLMQAYNNSHLEFHRMVTDMIDKSYLELSTDTKMRFEEAHKNAAALEFYKTLKKEVEDIYETALATRKIKEKLVVADIDEDHKCYASKLVDLQELIKISEGKLLTKKEYDNAIKKLRDSNEELRLSNLQYEAKIKELKSNIRKYEKNFELEHIENKIADEQERASVISLSRRAVRITINQTQQKINEVIQTKGKTSYNISKAKSLNDKLDRKYFKKHEYLKSELLMKLNVLKQMNLSNESNLTQLQTEHDLLLSKVKKSKEDIIKKQCLISEISKMNFKTKKYIDSNIKEMSNLLSQMPELKLINSDHQTEIKKLNTKLSNYNATNDKFKSELLTEFEALAKNCTDSYEMKRKQCEEMQSNNEKIKQMCKKKQDEITKLSLELKELNKSKENVIKEEEEIKKEIEILEKIVVKARQNSKGIKNPLFKEKEENSGDSF
ncbi:early endosome antigen 1-like isoform X1 [Aethina tumida]|uniref:early endosome antigen 1-like isoform X1 n=1 Tax=Aethina tumida TaxID=116153 RepID=UPI002147827A|nr:early endosome antigen 1-like isoform X1 [Aethina tumida]